MNEFREHVQAVEERIDQHLTESAPHLLPVWRAERVGTPAEIREMMLAVRGWSEETS